MFSFLKDASYCRGNIRVFIADVKVRKGIKKVRNINELIGIIKGINFDGVINSMEIARLQSWVDKNRNLAYEPRQVELIKLVDSVLEEHAINDDERELILAHAEQFLNVMSDNTARIYELNGIIEGIVCDGEVNEAEIYRLREWIDIYKDDIREYKLSTALCEIIDDIIEDGIVTEEEKNKLLEMLSASISNSQFETRLGYLCKQVKARKNIGIDLIDILDNQDAMEDIHQRAEVQLGMALNSYSGTYTHDPEVIFVSLCLIGMLEYDGSFYDSVRKTYVDLYRRYSTQKIEGLIRTLLNRFRTDEDRDKSSGVKNAIISVVLSNAIVPSHYLGAFFEFIFDIYKLNFEYDLPEDLYEEFKFVYDGLRSSMISDGDDVQDNVTKKTYKLIKSTKELIVDGNSIDAVIKLSIIIVKLIEKQIWNKGIKIYNPYLKVGFDKWKSTLKEDGSSGRERSISEWRSRWEPKYAIDGNDIFLVPPMHKVKSDYNYWDIYIQVLSDGKVIYEEKDPDIREIVAGYKVSGQRIKIDVPLDKISYRLMGGSRIIYDSCDKLYRNFVVFDQDGFEIQNNTDYKGTAIFCYKNEQEKLSSFYSAKGYKLASRNIRYGDSYFIENIVFNFSALMKPGIFGSDYENVYLIDAEKGNKLKVFREVKFLVFESENKSKTFEIMINTKAYKLSDFVCTTTERDGIIKHIVYLSICEAGVYEIIVNQLIGGKRKHIATFEFALDPEYDATLDKLDDSIFAYSVNSGLCDGIINGQIELATFCDEEISIEINNSIYYYLIPFDLGAYRISGSEWRTLSDELWIGDVSQDSILDIYDSEIDTVIVLSDKGPVLETMQLKDKGAYRQMNIGFLVSYKEEHDYTLLVFLKDGKKKRAVFCNNKCIMREETELFFDPVRKLLSINPWFYGKGNVYCEIFDSKGESVYRSEVLKNDDVVDVANLRSYDEYSITFFERGKGLTFKKNREMKCFKRVFYAREDFVGKEFRIIDISYKEGEIETKGYMLKKSYVRLLEAKGDGTYVAEIYIRNANPNYRSNLVKPLDVEICSEVINGKMELIVSKKGKPLTIDTSRNHVTDSEINKGHEVVTYTVVI